jgi:threonine dehydratase
LDTYKEPIDYVFVPIGGGGLASGLSTVFKQLSPNTKIIGVEPQGAPSMKTSIANHKNTALDTIDKFVDGAAVKQVGDLTFDICQKNLSDIILVPEGKVCTTILRLYNEEAMVVEPAGALTIAALDFYKDEIKGKTVVCIVSGSNNDIERTAEIKERSLLYEGLMHYFMIQFPQRPGALKEFVNEILGPDDDITYFQFAKKNSREVGSVVVGLELKNPNDILAIKTNMAENGFEFQYLNDNQNLYTQLIG